MMNELLFKTRSNLTRLISLDMRESETRDWIDKLKEAAAARMQVGTRNTRRRLDR